MAHKMTRKDFELIAEIISNMPETDSGLYSKQDVAFAFADSLRLTNPAFSKQRFYEAATSERYRAKNGASQYA